MALLNEEKKSFSIWSVVNDAPYVLARELRNYQKYD